MFWKRTVTKSQEYAESIINTVRRPLVILDQDLRVVTASRSFYEVFKVNPEETMGQLIYDLGNKQWDIPKLRELLETILPQKTTFDNYEVEHDFATIGRRIMLLNARQIQRVLGKERIILLAIEDITDRKRAEEALHESEVKYRELFENAQVGMFRSKMDGSAILAVNPKLCELFGYSEEEMLRDPASIRWAHPEARDRMVAKLRQSGSLHDYEMDILTKSGKIRNFSISVHLYPEQGYLEGSAIDITERKRTEEALHRSEEMHRLLSEFTWDWIYLLDNDNRFVYCSPSCERITGYLAEEFVNDPSLFLHIVHPEDRALVAEHLIAYHLFPDHGEAEFRIICRDGKVRWIGHVCKAVVAEDGRYLGRRSGNRDITERKLAEEAERYSRKELDRLFEVSPEMIGIIGFDGRFKRLNPAWEKALGYPIDTMLSRQFIEYVHPDDIEATNAEAAKLAIGKRTIQFENRYRCTDGSYRWLSWSVIPVIEEKLLYGVARDITERKRVEELLSMQKRIGDVFFTVQDDEMFNEVLKIVLDLMQSPYGVFGYLDDAGALVVPSMTRHIWDKCQVAEKSFIFPMHTWGDSSWARAIREKQSNHSNEISVKTPKGHITLTRHISLPILFQGEVIGLFQVANKETDYTDADINILETIAGYVSPVLSARLQRQLREKEIRQLNAELEDRVVLRTAQLEASNKELDAFTYSVSHDLRAPLRHISGYVELLTSRFHSTLSDKGQHYLDSIADSVHQMGKLIDNLLQFSRTGRAEMRRTELEMNGIVQEVVESVRKDNPGRAIKWVVGKLPSAYGDDTTVRLVWMNLLSNAVKFTRTREKALIEIGAKVETKEVIYFVRDNGVGFDMQYGQKLFGVFQRLHPTEEFEGTGIGLANVHRIVVRHGGRTWAEAELNKGATFYFAIPHN
jgi:PAS domain S-box-containing protein